jgi:DNA-binding XRE family transcriptional regulator
MAKTKYQKNFPELAEAYAKEGMTEAQIAHKLGVSVAIFEVYKNKYPEFLESLKRGKVQPDDEVEGSLFKSAMGFTGPNGTYYPPNPTSLIFWLKNRRREKWRDKQDVDMNMKSDPNEAIKTLIEKLEKEEMKKLEENAYSYGSREKDIKQGV